MEIIEKVKELIVDLIACTQMIKLYSGRHKIFEDSIDKLYESAQETLKERDELVIGIVGDEFVFEKEIFFELSKTSLAGILIASLRARGIERIIFYPQLHKEELEMFITFVVNPLKEQIEGNSQKYLAALGIRNIAVDKIRTPNAPAETVIKKKLQEATESFGIYEDYSNKASEYLEAPLNNAVIDHLALRIVLLKIIENLSVRKEFLKFSVIKRDEAARFLHFVNVSILAMYLSSKLGFSQNDTLDIGIAALFHDIGKIYISRELRSSNNRLTKEESADIKSHTQLGPALLLKYVDTLGILPVVVSFEHHLRYDLKAYSELLSGYKPHIASLIISICDVYDALCQRRSYKYGYPPDAIYNLMMKGRGSAFEPDLLDTFFRVTGVWPIGTVVLLSDNRVAIVRQENEDDIFRPKVEIAESQDKNELIDLKDKKAELKIERALNPLTEGKVYLRLI
ncbi:HD-GYP domain-containing protein [Candidatus Omnitrophota bacterium]